ncbi:hypothetical protein IW140_000984 [Coemansia sp. RSA 1813]|nr:hypothetical protein IW138_001793 [Coemansia sp. RSA 986]KAJ2572235.1 hypothetical protein IW140_000984 [Coemansia sp. RSA 1813]
MKYGDFTSLCDRSPLPVCRVFKDYELPSCSLHGYSAGSSFIVNLPDFVASIIAFLVMMYLAFRAHRKIAAVGRREITVLFLLFAIMLAFNIAGADFIHNSRTANRWLGAVNTALVVAFFCILILFGSVGFQFMADGSFASILTFVGVGIVIFITMGFIAVDTAFGVSSGLQPKPSQPFLSYGLFTIYLVFPLVAIVIFMVMQTIIVVKFLAVRRPLLWLLCAFICFAVAQALMFGASEKICTGSNSKIDGAFFATLLDTAALVCVYGFWSTITVDDSEEYDDVYKY